MQKLSGTAMTELVEHHRLRRADIFLARYKRSFYGWIARLFTRCYWNHAFIIYMVADPLNGFNKALIIDPKMGSIHLDDIAYYLDNPQKYDVAVKRFEADWFQNDGTEGGKPFCSTVCNVALRETADRYDTRFVKRYLRKVFRFMRLIYRYVRRRIKYPGRGRKKVQHFTRRLKINTFSCSGFVQWSYYRGVYQLLKDSPDKSGLEEVVFNPRLKGEITEEDLLTTLPTDLACSEKLAWKYVVKDGVVWEVSSEAEVNLAIKAKRAGN
jgi:hypothetical protein